jgi:glycosyltransferase involved in cell wall biosynthesis
MRITIVQGAFLPIPPELGGGVEKIWFSLGKEFAKRGHSVTHISRRYGTLAPEETVDGVCHIRIPGFDTPRSMVKLKWRDLVYSKRALKALPEADILVTNTFWLPVLVTGAKQGSLYVHIARYPKGQIKFYGRAARLQAVSTVVGNEVRRQAPKLAPRVKAIPNFVPSAASKLVEQEREQVLLYVGRVHPEKGVHLLLETFGRLWAEGLREWKLRIVGPWEVNLGGGGKEYHDGLRKQSREFDHLVEWMGPVFEKEALSSHYRRASLFVYPSLAERGETFGLSPLEAMAEGCPAVVSSLPCFLEYIKPGINGWSFDHRGANPAENLANALKAVFNDARRLAEFREPARRTAQEFSLEKVANQFLNDFEEIIHR